MADMYVLCIHYILLFISMSEVTSESKIIGVRLSNVSPESTYDEGGVINLMAGVKAELTLLGTDLTDKTIIKLTTARMKSGDDCGESNGTLLLTKELPAEKREGTIKITIGENDVVYSSEMDRFFICLKSTDGRYIHQGVGSEVSIRFFERLLPIWLMIILVTFLLILSGLFSGLNLGLMALDQTELQILIKTGSESEQEAAKQIVPVRALGNFLLCSLLLGNVLVNNSLTIMLDNLTGGGGLYAIIGSTFGIVVFGEIIPQAICSRHGLAVGAKTLGITKFFMLLTSPLSFPISKILDFLLGKELGTVYNRARLIELLRVTQDNIDLNKDEVNILTGALVLQEKKVEDIMTPLGDCFMLSLDAVLDFETISNIKEKGYSRIPVYDEEESNVVHILMAKDLLFVDPDDKKPLKEVCEFYKTPFISADKNTPLNKMLDDFKTGVKGHLAMVTCETDNVCIGLVTLEDIIEEIIQSEIVDETDVVIDNKSKKKTHKKGRFLKEKEVRMFMEPTGNKIEVSPQIFHAVIQFLSTSIPQFHADKLKPNILKKMLQLDVFRTARLSSTDQDVNSFVILKEGKACDYFILIIEGKVEVEIGKEGYVFESGPFSSYGKQILGQVLTQYEEGEGDVRSKPVARLSWIPECTIKAKSDDLLFLKIHQKTYRAALQASKEKEGDLDSNEEVEKHIRSMIQSQNSTDCDKETDPLL